MSALLVFGEEVSIGGRNFLDSSRGACQDLYKKDSQVCTTSPRACDANRHRDASSFT